MAIGMGFGRDHWSVPTGMVCLLAGLALLGRELEPRLSSIAGRADMARPALAEIAPGAVAGER